MVLFAGQLATLTWRRTTRPCRSSSSLCESGHLSGLFGTQSWFPHIELCNKHLLKMILKNQWLHFSVPIIASQLLFYPWLLYCVIVKITTLFERREKWLQTDSMEEPGEQSAVVFALIVTGPAGSDNVCVASPPTPHPPAVAEFINPWLGVKVDSDIEFSYRPASPCYHVAWRAGTTTLCPSWLYPPSQGYWVPYQFMQRRQCIVLQITPCSTLASLIFWVAKWKFQQQLKMCGFPYGSAIHPGEYINRNVSVYN